MLCSSCGRRKGRRKSGWCEECEKIRKSIRAYPDPTVKPDDE